MVLHRARRYRAGRRSPDSQDPDFEHPQDLNLSGREDQCLWPPAASAASDEDPTQQNCGNRWRTEKFPAATLLMAYRPGHPRSRTVGDNQPPRPSAHATISDSSSPETPSTTTRGTWSSTAGPVVTASHFCRGFACPPGSRPAWSIRQPPPEKGQSQGDAGATAPCGE